MAPSSQLPDVVTTIIDRTTGARFDVVAFRKLSNNEAAFAARHFAQQKRQRRKSWRPKNGETYRIVTVIE